MAAGYFISTTIPYVNAHPHLGHALEYVQTDSYARFRRAQGRDVFFLTGSDENSLKNVLAAEREGISTRELVDRNVTYFEELLAGLGLSNDDFIRTSVARWHADGATAVWERMAARGDIYTKAYQGLYCVGCEQFYHPEELLDGLCPEHLVAPEPVSEENYFFRLSRYGDELLRALEDGRIKVVPETRLNEVTSFVNQGLEDISISRSVGRARDWGVPVPGDPSQVMYVWIDALTNYITALGWVEDHERYRRYWAQAEDRVHVVGKGVIRFHAVYWPAMLMSAGLPLPTEIVVHGYITAAGHKLSKSLGNVVDPAALIATYGAEPVRYALLADFAPFTDGDFSEERLVAKYNADLANGLGNLVARVTTLTVRDRDGVVPRPAELTGAEQALAAAVADATAGCVEAMERYEHREALNHVANLVRRANAYVNDQAPWELAKAARTGDATAGARLDTTLHHLVAVIRHLGGLMLPFLPDAAARILDTVGEESRALPGAAAWTEGIAGRTVTKPETLFPRLEAPGVEVPAS
jgi:methionyl-tRNA synthetase